VTFCWRRDQIRPNDDLTSVRQHWARQKCGVCEAWPVLDKGTVSVWFDLWNVTWPQDLIKTKDIDSNTGCVTRNQHQMCNRNWEHLIIILRQGGRTTIRTFTLTKKNDIETKKRKTKNNHGSKTKSLHPMHSPHQEKGTRPVSPWPKDYHTLLTVLDSWISNDGSTDLSIYF
jgi:hypothetical protein